MNNQIVFHKMFSLLCFTALYFVLSLSVKADGLGTANITTIKNQVLISKEDRKGRAAAIKDVLTSKTMVTTGKNSHVELLFADRSIVRLGSNTVFSFNSKTREMNFQRGIALIHVPQNRGGTKIRTPLATATIHGDVIAVRCAGKDKVTEFVHLSPKDAEGPMTVTHNKTGEQREVGAGQLLKIYPSEAHLLKPVDVSVAVFVHTSSLLAHIGKNGARISSHSPSTKTTDRSVTSDNTANGGTGESPSRDITANTTINTPVVEVTDTVTADTSATGSHTTEDFTELPATAESEITQEEANQTSQVQSGTLVVSSQTQEDTTVTVTATSGTTDASVSTSIDSSTTSTVSPIDSDVTLLVEAETTAESLITQVSEDPIHSTSTIVEEDDVITDTTAEVLCTSTDILHPCHTD